jgi:hypothetical protein
MAKQSNRSRKVEQLVLLLLDRQCGTVSFRLKRPPEAKPFSPLGRLLRQLLHKGLPSKARPRVEPALERRMPANWLRII